MKIKKNWKIKQQKSEGSWNNGRQIDDIYSANWLWFLINQRKSLAEGDEGEKNFHLWLNEYDDDDKTMTMMMMMVMMLYISKWIN